jgi:hypothetical protein
MGCENGDGEPSDRDMNGEGEGADTGPDVGALALDLLLLEGACPGEHRN